MQLEASSSGARCAASPALYTGYICAKNKDGGQRGPSQSVFELSEKRQNSLFFFHLNEATQQETGAAKKLQGHRAEMLNRAQFMLHCAVAKKITPVKYVHGHVFPVLLLEHKK